MRQNANKYGLAVILLLFAIAMTGCGSSSDLLDELGWRWRTDSPKVYDGETERYIVDPTTTDPASIELTFTSSADTETDVFLRDITLTFQGDGYGPALASRRYSGDGTLLSGNGGSLTEKIYFLTATNKAQYLAAIGGSADNFSSDYSVSIVAHFSYTQDADSDDVTIEEDTFFTVAPATTPTPTPTPSP